VYFLKFFHDKNSEKYAYYYTMVLIIIIGFVITMNFGIIQISPIEGIPVFFEGFVSLYMLSRHKETQEKFEHIIKIKYT